MKDKLVIYGSGGLGRGVMELVKTLNKDKEVWDVLGFIDDQNDGYVNGYPIVGDLQFILECSSSINVVLAIAEPKVKQDILKKLKNNRNVLFPNLIHPNVYVPEHIKLGKGNIISYGVALSTNIEINNFNLIHYNCSVGHDVKIGDFNSIFPLSAISGYVRLEDGIVVGTNASIIPNVLISNNAIIGAGSTIINDVKTNRKLVGTPGKEI